MAIVETAFVAAILPINASNSLITVGFGMNVCLVTCLIRSIVGSIPSSFIWRASLFTFDSCFCRISFIYMASGQLDQTLPLPSSQYMAPLIDKWLDRTSLLL